MTAVNLTVFIYLLVVSCCGPLLVRAALVEVPQNEAVLAGSTVELRCKVHADIPNVRILWMEYASDKKGKKISDGKYLSSDHPSVKRFSLVGGYLDYTLQIRNVQLNDSGTYRCWDFLAVPPAVSNGYAELIVVEADPVCKDNVKESGEVIDGYNYSAECKINYNGSIVPQMAWVGPGTFVSNSSTTSNFVWSMQQFTAKREIEGGAFKCLTRFGKVIAGKDHANNTPAYQYTYEGPKIRVKWGPQNVVVTPIKPQYKVGDVLTCTADSNPASTFEWLNLRTMETAPPGPKFFVTEALAGYEQTIRCNAMAFIDGAVQTSDTFVNVVVSPPTGIKVRW